MPPFQLEAPFRPCGDQVQAIDKLVAGIAAGRKHQTLLGVTGSGKTFTMANVVANAATMYNSKNQKTAVIVETFLIVVVRILFGLFYPNTGINYMIQRIFTHILLNGEGVFSFC